MKENIKALWYGKVVPFSDKSENFDAEKSLQGFLMSIKGLLPKVLTKREKRI